MTLFTRMLAVHMRTAEPARYEWVRRPGMLARIWGWLREHSDWERRQWSAPPVNRSRPQRHSGPRFCFGVSKN